MYVQKYVIVKFLEKVNDSAEFAASNWPLHITLVSNFTVNWDTSLFNKLSTFTDKIKPIEIVAGEDEYFGIHKNIKVTVLETNTDLMLLHRELISLLKDVGAVFDEPKYIENGYRAHATVQLNNRLQKGDHIVIDNLTVVDMFPNKDINMRKPLSTVKLLGK